MNKETESNLEVQRLERAYKESQELLEKGDCSAAHATLIQLPQPETKLGREIMSQIRVIQLIYRACMLMQEGGDSKEIESLLKQFLQKAPDDDAFRELRRLANALPIVLTTDLTKLTKEQQEQIEQAGFTQVIYQTKATKDALKEFEDAITALRVGNENEFANKMAQAEALFRKAGQENPKTRDLIWCQWLVLQLLILSEQQVGTLLQFDFDRVQAMAVQFEQKANELKQIHSNSNIHFLISWGPQIGNVYQSLSVAFVEFAGLMKDVIGESVKAKHLETLKKLDNMLREIRGQATKIQGNRDFVEPAREQLLKTSSEGLQIINNLRIGIRPSPQAVLSSSGIAAAVGFLFVVAITFLTGNLFAVTLNPTLVLTLGAFFGLVIGFGYGAIRFRGFLLGLIRGDVGGAKGDGDDGA